MLLRRFQGSLTLTLSTFHTIRYRQCEQSFNAITTNKLLSHFKFSTLSYREC